jgi:hypothetical protein
MSLTNFELLDLARMLKIRVVVTLQDQLVDYKADTKNGKYIINLDSLKNGGTGTHWCALAFKKNEKNGKNECMYFDSFGAPPTQQIKAFIPKDCQFAYINHISQAIESELCGWYSILFLSWNSRSTNKSLIESSNEFSNLFSENADFNAGRVRSYTRMWLPNLPKRLFDILHEKIIYT